MLWKIAPACGKPSQHRQTKSLMANRGVMKTVLRVLWHIRIANLSAKALLLPENMIVASAINALPYIIRAESDEPDKLDEFKPDNTTYTNKEWVETNNTRRSTRKKTTTSPPNRNADNVLNSTQSAMDCQDQRNKQTETGRMHNM